MCVLKYGVTIHSDIVEKLEIWQVSGKSRENVVLLCGIANVCDVMDTT